MIGCLSYAPWPRIEPAAQECALTRNRTPNPLGHAGQGSGCASHTSPSFFVLTLRRPTGTLHHPATAVCLSRSPRGQRTWWCNPDLASSGNGKLRTQAPQPGPTTSEAGGDDGYDSLFPRAPDKATSPTGLSLPTVPREREKITTEHEPT